MLEDGRFYTAIWAEGASSNGTTSLAPQSKVEHTAVRRWVSTVEGDVTISGHVAKILAWGGDHNKVHIVVDGAAVFSTALAPPTKADRDAIFIGGEDYSVRIKVQVGSLVDFLVSPAPPETGGAFGPVKFTATIRTDREVRAGSGSG